MPKGQQTTGNAGNSTITLDGTLELESRCGGGVGEPVVHNFKLADLPHHSVVQILLYGAQRIVNDAGGNEPDKVRERQQERLDALMEGEYTFRQKAVGGLTPIERQSLSLARKRISRDPALKQRLKAATDKSGQVEVLKDFVAKYPKTVEDASRILEIMGETSGDEIVIEELDTEVPVEVVPEGQSGRKRKSA